MMVENMMVNIIQDNGKIIKEMEKEHIIIQMEKSNMKGNILMIEEKGMENLLMRKENIIGQENLKMIIQMVKGNSIILLMEKLFMKVILSMANSKEKEN